MDCTFFESAGYFFPVNPSLKPPKMKGEVLKIYAEQHGITQSQLASMLKISQQTISQHMSSPDLKTSTVEKYCEAFGIRIYDLYAETHQPETVHPGYQTVPKDVYQTLFAEYVRLGSTVETLRRQIENLKKKRQQDGIS